MSSQARRRISRRSFITGTAALAVASSLPMGFARAGGGARYRRYSVWEPEGEKALAIFEQAIASMLKGSPNDPLGWHRHAMIHTLDCPHSNWWFLVWHRAYIGWLEQICRKVSGEAHFALPYWDWSRKAAVPPAFFKGALNPANYPYPDADSFRAAFKGVIPGLWQNLSPEQHVQLKERGLDGAEAIWQEFESDFYTAKYPRELTADAPGLGAASAPAVQHDTVVNCLAPKDFTDFGSHPAAAHSLSGGEAPLEQGPHDHVHGGGGGVGGFMSAMMSPIDPLFFVHHANLDRLWDVWTRKQQRFGLPYLPADDKWSHEPFRFFVDPQGKPVARILAGDYRSMSVFDYDYQPGSGEEVATGELLPAPSPFSRQSFAATLPGGGLVLARATTAVATLPQALLEAASLENGPTVYARITVQAPADPRHVTYLVLVDAGDDAARLGPESPHFAGSIVFFAIHSHQVGMDATYDVPLSGALRALRAAKRLDTTQPLRIQVVPKALGEAPRALQSALRQVVVGVY
jgi:tyrosinase